MYINNQENFFLKKRARLDSYPFNRLTKKNRLALLFSSQIRHYSYEGFLFVSGLWVAALSLYFVKFQLRINLKDCKEQEQLALFRQELRS
jgi:hypothetical protein